VSKTSSPIARAPISEIHLRTIRETEKQSSSVTSGSIVYNDNARNDKKLAKYVRPSRAPLPRSTVTASANCKNAVIATAAASSRVGFYSPVTRENADNIRRLGRIAKKPLPLASQKLQLFPQARVILWSRNFAHKSDTVPAGSPSVRASLAGKLRYHCNILNLSLSLSLSLFFFFFAEEYSLKKIVGLLRGIANPT